MPICRAGAQLIHFAHIPKAGGSSIEAYLRTKGTLAMTASSRPEGLPCTPQHFHAALFEPLFPADLFTARFAVLRHPVERMVSEFLWRSEPLKPLQRVARPIKGGRARRIKLEDQKKSLTFDEWVPKALAALKRDGFIYDNHLRPQVDFVTEDMGLFTLEAGLDPVFRWLDAVTETAASDGQFWAKKSQTPAPAMKKSTRRAIETHYAEDLALWQSIHDQQTAPQTAE
ncbi:sulfotransferase family 2 domain-containing protein [Pacificoceanicola onchidii]|uniref:sulfotransferase family 2 domain-containing protein n=1 Tax=Pacificoceanicola onchidii TaxID=2562685 RepID=UPI0010A5CA18|nr:sulfotransferase family 2 domain-containing protein [Pacificoceanicola onchidii]